MTELGSVGGCLGPMNDQPAPPPANNSLKWSNGRTVLGMPCKPFLQQVRWSVIVTFQDIAPYGATCQYKSANPTT